MVSADLWHFSFLVIKTDISQGRNYLQITVKMQSFRHKRNLQDDSKTIPWRRPNKEKKQHIKVRGKIQKIRRHDSKILTKRLNSWPVESRGSRVINLSACTIMEINISCLNAN